MLRFSAALSLPTRKFYCDVIYRSVKSEVVAFYKEKAIVEVLSVSKLRVNRGDGRRVEEEEEAGGRRLSDK